MRTSEPYTVEITPSAQRDMNRLDLPIARRVAAALRDLGLDPRPHGCTKMRGPDDLWRIVIGEWRAIYRIDDTSSLCSWSASGIAARCTASPRQIANTLLAGRIELRPLIEDWLRCEMKIRLTFALSSPE